jgi:hypothetical protein
MRYETFEKDGRTFERAIPENDAEKRELDEGADASEGFADVLARKAGTDTDID